MKRLKLFSLTAISLFMALVFTSCDDEDPIKDIVDFEDLVLDESGIWNGSGLSGGFQSGNAFFPNSYNTDYQSWSGFAYTNHTDTETGDYTNQYSAIAGSGAGGSSQYGVLYTFSTDTLKFTLPEKITNLSLCNSTYAYKVMLEGNEYAKQFGGPDGTDPDYFKLIVEALDENNATIGTADIFLADFRFEDQEQDYISNVWSDLDLRDWGYVSALVFSFESTDTGDFGMNTPSYVCIDNIEGELKGEV